MRWRAGFAAALLCCAPAWAQPAPASGDLRDCRAQVLAGDPGQAQATCARAVALMPAALDAVAQLGHAHLLAGDRAAAWGQYDKALRLATAPGTLRDGPMAELQGFVRQGRQAALAQQALEWFEHQVGPWQQATPQVEAWIAQGRAAQARGQPAQALALAQQSAALTAQAWRADSEAMALQLNWQGELHHALGQHAQAALSLERAVALAEQVLGPEHVLTGVRLANLGTVYGELGRHAQAEPLLLRALGITEKAFGPDHVVTGARLNTLVVLYLRTGQHARAEPLARRALAITEKAMGPDHALTATRLNNLAMLLDAMGRPALAEPLMRRALAVTEKTLGPDHRDTGARLHNLAAHHQRAGQFAQAELLYRRSMAIAEKTVGSDHPDMANHLNDFAHLYMAMGQLSQAEALMRRAVAITERTRGAHHASLGTQLGALATVLADMGRLGEADPIYLRALAVTEQALGPDHPSVGQRLNNLALFRQRMGQHTQAETMFLRALAVTEKSLGPAHPETSARLHNLANLYALTGRATQAEPLLRRALEIVEAARGPTHPDVGTYLNNLALLYKHLGQPAQAEPLLQRALQITESAMGPEHPDTGIRVANLASVQAVLGRMAPAEALQARALLIAEQIESPTLRFGMYRDHASFQAARAQRDAAIYYGKLAVNTFQSIRGNAQDLDAQTQRSLLQDNRGIYQQLAAWLTQAGRLAEAEQVLAMLKEQELFELTRRSGPSATQADMTGPELALERQRQSLGQGAVARAAELEGLRRAQRQGATLDAVQQARLAQLETERQQWTQTFQRHLAGIQAALSSDPQAAQAARQTIERGARSLRTVLAGANRHGERRHVALSTIVTEDSLSLVLTTADGAFARQAAVTRSALNTAIGQLRQALQDPARDPRPAGQALYRLLFAPIEQDLQTLAPQVLVLNLSDALRYIPFGALNDGQQYLVQRYEMAVYTSAGGAPIAPAMPRAWQVAGLGLTQAVRVQDTAFRALPAVRDELSGIVRTPTTPQGVLPGSLALDAQFTRGALQQALASAGQGQSPVLHIASHFHLAPGSDHGSYLVTGDAQALRLSEIKEMDFQGVQLLTLSACDTASQGGRNENGSEVEGLAAAVQVAGAGSVLASLWPVADASTAQLMQRFYRLRSGPGPQTHAQALRQAQLEMLQGGAEPSAPAPQAQRGVEVPAPATAQAPAFNAPAGSPFAHPYYWAPFILMGNWL